MRAGGGDVAVADQHGAAVDRRGAVADDEFGVDDRDRLRGSGRGDEGRGGGEEREQALHLTSPAPGWPSSKSDTGRRFGSLAS